MKKYKSKNKNSTNLKFVQNVSYDIIIFGYIMIYILIL